MSSRVSFSDVHVSEGIVDGEFNQFFVRLAKVKKVGYNNVMTTIN